MRIAIIGGGIGGLTLALALRQRGMEPDVYEQASELAEIGAAVALSANATRELGRLGLLEQIQAVSTEPSELIYRNWRTGERIAAHAVNLGLRYRRECGAPYFGVHRADLQRILSGGLGGAGLHLGHQLASLEERGRAIGVTFANGKRIEADLVIGADGVRSVVRRFITGSEETVYSGTSAFRGIVPIERLPTLPDPKAIQFWMGPDAHLLHYAIGGRGESVNFFAVIERPKAWPHGDKWLDPIEPGEAPKAFAGWHPAVIEMVSQHLPVRWGLFGVRPLLHWFRGAAVLIGDAAHGMLPHHGQGANTTIEDAITLAELLPGTAPDGLASVLARYQSLRRARTRKIQRSSWVTNAALHLPDGPALADRDRRVARFPEEFGWMLCSRSETRGAGEASMQQIDETALAGLLDRPRGTRLEELGLDSLARIDLAVAAEDRFGVAIPDETLEGFVTVGDVLDHIRRAKA
jgi:salicylate hydroxylase